MKEYSLRPYQEIKKSLNSQKVIFIFTQINKQLRKFFKNKNVRIKNIFKTRFKNVNKRN